MGTGRQLFGRLPDGTPIDLFTLTNRAGMRAKVASYGGILVSLLVRDRVGRLADVVLGFDSLADYLRENLFLGATVGRFAGLIARGRFVLDGVEYKLARNCGENHIHGGLRGFDKVAWSATAVGGSAVHLTYTSRDGEEGYPGRLSVSVTYTVTEADELRIDYAATTDRPTVLNLTHHSYFNLAGHGAGDVLDHELTIFADRFNPIDSEMLPLGGPAPVEGTPLDFTQPRKIGERIDDDDDQIRYGLGYDHNWILNGWNGTLRPAARVRESTSGRVMDMFTTEPGVQFYAANMMPAEVRGKEGAVYRKRQGLCLETQHFPDSPNRPEFPTTVLRPGGKYEQTTVYRFSTD